MTFYELDEAGQRIVADAVDLCDPKGELTNQLSDVIFGDLKEKKADGIEPSGFQAREVLVASPRRPGFS